MLARLRSVLGCRPLAHLPPSASPFDSPRDPPFGGSCEQRNGTTSMCENRLTDTRSLPPTSPTVRAEEHLAHEQRKEDQMSCRQAMTPDRAVVKAIMSAPTESSTSQKQICG